MVRSGGVGRWVVAAGRGVDCGVWRGSRGGGKGMGGGRAGYKGVGWE